MKMKLVTKRNSIFKKIIIYFFIILLIQCILVYGILSLGGVITRLHDNAFDILNEKVKNRRNNIEDYMVKQWSNLDDALLKVKGKIDTVVKEGGGDYSDVIKDSNASVKLIDSLTEDLIYTLRRNKTTGAFVVLNTGKEDYPAKGEKVYKRGIYIRDHDPSYNSSDYGDLMMEVGPAAVSKKLRITLDTSWESEFCFDGDSKGNDYFYKPYIAAEKYKEASANDLGYWSPSFNLNKDKVDIITYSIPIISDSGEVYGVLGIEVTEEHIENMLPDQEISKKRQGSYVLAVKNDSELSFKNTISNGAWYSSRFKDSEYISFNSEDIYNKNYLINQSNLKEKAYGTIRYLKLYNSNTPFQGEKWAVIGLVDENDLFGFSDSLKRKIIISILLSLVIGTIIIFILSKRISSPVISLATKVRKSSVDKPIKLDRVGIIEIDELSESIENLRESVADYSSKLYQITSMSDYYISAFEYKYGANKVFITSNFLDIIDEDSDVKEENYIEVDSFREIFFNLEKSLEEIVENERSRIYKVNNNKDPMWIKVKIKDNGKEVLGVILDITKDYTYRKKIEYERDYDLLTNIPNRRAFNSILEELFTRKECLKVAAMIMIDLDNLKHINDTYGHDYGDKYICLAGSVLKEIATKNIVVSRMSGDEFYVFIYGYESEDEIRDEISSFKEKLNSMKMNVPDNSTIKLRLSAGVSWYPKDANTYEMLIKYADFAMYRVKRTTKGEFCDFDFKLYEKESFIINGKEEINRIIDERLVTYMFQPIVSAVTGNVYAYEALMRPKSETIKSPIEVLELAKSQSKLYQIEKITFFKCLEEYSKFPNALNYKIFINSISNKILSSEDIENLESMFSLYLKNVVVEITEDEKIDKEFTKIKKRCIKRWGGEVALDDFGSGYSGEGTLLVVVPNYIKIDRSIINDIDKDANRQIIFENIVNYAKKQGVSVIAEGVETSSELEKVMLCGADYIQGYYLGKPDYSLKEIEPFIANEIKEIRKGLSNR